ncbi:MAG: TolC family protein, partial [Sphingobacteriales bacterium]
GWFQKKNNIAKNDLLHQASHADLTQLQNDIALNITNSYLRILLAKEQIKIHLQQLEVSNRQVKRTETLLAAGRSNGQDLAQVKAQLSGDSANYFKAMLILQQTNIDMKAILNFQLNDSLEIAQLDINQIDADLLLSDPETIYKDAEFMSQSIKSSDLKMLITQKDIDISRSALYPQISIGISAGTNYSSSFSQLSPIGEVKTMSFGRQFQNNFSQRLSLGLTLPIFNGFRDRYAVKISQLTFNSVHLYNLEVRASLRQEIYKACNDMRAAYQACAATNASLKFAQTALEYAQKRFDKGLINAIELLIAQNAVFKASVDSTSAKYDYIFKQMVLQYYLSAGVFK